MAQEKHQAQENPGENIDINCAIRYNENGYHMENHKRGVMPGVSLHVARVFEKHHSVSTALYLY